MRVFERKIKNTQITTKKKLNTTNILKFIIQSHISLPNDVFFNNIKIFSYDFLYRLFRIKTNNFRLNFS